MTADNSSLQAELDAVRAEAARLKEMAARAQADLQNSKERLRREADDLRKFAVADVLIRLLPTIDNFQRAFAHLPADLQNHEWVKGIAAVEQQLMKDLADSGLSRMSSLGAPIDPDRHEVLTTGPGIAGTVVEVIEEGYLLHDKVLRPAKVKAGE